MTEHGHYAHRAVRDIGDAKSLRYALQLRDEAVARRDPEREARANALYEELRVLSKEELLERAGWDEWVRVSRQELITEIIMEET